MRPKHPEQTDLGGVSVGRLDVPLVHAGLHITFPGEDWILIGNLKLRGESLGELQGRNTLRDELTKFLEAAETQSGAEDGARTESADGVEDRAVVAAAGVDLAARGGLPAGVVDAPAVAVVVTPAGEDAPGARERVVQTGDEERPVHLEAILIDRALGARGP